MTESDAQQIDSSYSFSEVFQQVVLERLGVAFELLQIFFFLGGGWVEGLKSTQGGSEEPVKEVVGQIYPVCVVDGVVDEFGSDGTGFVQVATFNQKREEDGHRSRSGQEGGLQVGGQGAGRAFVQNFRSGGAM